VHLLKLIMFFSHSIFVRVFFSSCVVSVSLFIGFDNYCVCKFYVCLFVCLLLYVAICCSPLSFCGLSVCFAICVFFFYFFFVVIVFSQSIVKRNCEL